jgi:intein-encoded DNA endonuclease-like protein
MGNKIVNVHSNGENTFNKIKIYNNNSTKLKF